MENVRTEQLLGNTKVIVGNRYSDLVLETLGKVYIKTGNNSRVLSDVLKLLDLTSEQEIKSLTIFVDNTSLMEEMEYPGDGYFIYNKLNTTLYISYDERYIALIEAAEGAKEGYVRRSGDTMTGSLEIITATAPLIVASSKLVKNLNAEYISGYSESDLAKKKVDEYIYGNWTFKGKGVSENSWVFKENVRMYGDLVTNMSITSPEFASGFGGYGWRIDADTNTLTIDYLVVRKAMRVYEMVINKISATNGSIWVSNSSKCSDAVQPVILTDTLLRSIGSWTGSLENKDALLRLIKTNTYYLPIPSDGSNTDSTVTLTSELSKPSSINTTPKTFINYKFIIHIKDPIGLVSSSLFKGSLTLYDETLLSSEWETYDGSASETEYLAFKKCISLYYINKEKVVTKWGGNEGLWDGGTIPLEWTYLYTFDKDFSFYMIPKTSTAISDFENHGSSSQYLTRIKTYYKYFALEQSIINSAILESDSLFSANIIPSTSVPNLWVINTDDDEYPLFKPGDIIRCQKYSDGNIKYYDAIIMALIGSRLYILQKAVSVFDIYTKISYNEDGSVAYTEEEYNSTLYSKTESSYNVNTGTILPKSVEANSAQTANPDTSSLQSSSRLDDVASGDDMILMGNIQDVQRQNAIYLTSCDNDGPFIDVISGLNRPDYSVLYDTPIYKRESYIYRKENSTFKYNGLKYNYYILREVPDGEYIDGIIIDDIQYYGTLYPTKLSIIMQDGSGKYKHAYTKTTRVRLGNLDGIYNETFKNKQPYGYGLYGENVFLTGEFYLNNGKSVVEFTLDEVNIIQGELDKLWTAIQLNSKDILLLANKIEDINGSITTMSSEIKVNADNIAAQTSRIDSINNTITNSGWITSADSIRIFTELVNALGIAKTAEIKTYVNDLIAGIKLSADLITLEGYTTINNGFRIDTSGNMYAVSGKIGGFTLSNGSLSWDVSNFIGFEGQTFKYTNKCNIGQTTNDLSPRSGVVDIAYNMITGPYFGISIQGLGVSLFSSQYSPDVKNSNGLYETVNYPSSDLRAAGYFDGEVYSNSYFIGKFGCPNSDGTYTTGLFPDKTEELPDLDRIRIQVRGGLIVGYRGE